jgi:hypothetical protein
MTRAIRNVLHGPLPEKWNSLKDAPHLWRKLPYALLLASLFVFGFWPRLLTDKITPDAVKVVAAYPVTATAPQAAQAAPGFIPADARGANPAAQNLVTSAATK